MRSLQMLVLCMLVAGSLAAWSVAALPAPAVPVNLVGNGGFEKPGDGVPLASWTSGCAEGGVLARDTTVKQDGAASLKLSVTKKGNVWVASEPFAVKAGQRYLVTFSYRAEGLGDKGWVGADDSGRLLFIDEQNKQIVPANGNLKNVGYPWVIGCPYTDVKDWQQAAVIYTAPAGAVKACFQFALNNTNEAISPSAWLDTVCVSDYTPAEAKGKTYVFKPNAPLHPYNTEIVGGMAVSTKGTQKAGTIVSGPYTKEIPCGLYAVAFRMKTADNTITTPVLQLTVETDGLIGGRSGTLVVTGTDFKAPDTFQDITVYAVKGPNGWLAFPIYWAGDATITLESVTVTEISTLTADAWSTLLKPQDKK